MSWGIDHVFFATAEPDALERELRELGATLTPHRTHSGQGTASTSLMLENAYFEILFARDRDELCSEVVRPLGLDERARWRETGACPFGLCFRPSDLALAPSSWPFTTWHYKPAYVKVGEGIPIVTPPRCLSEPLVFVSTFPGHGRGDEHRGARRVLSAVNVSLPPSGVRTSQGLEWLTSGSLVSVSTGPSYSIELVWDHGKNGETLELSSAPIRIRW